MAQIEFADGVQVVDDVYVTPIMEVTGLEPKRFTFRAAMALIGNWFEKNHLRKVQADIIAGHLREFGL